MRNETQTLLEEIARKERELDGRSQPAQWWSEEEPRWLVWVTRVAVTLGLAAFWIGIISWRVAEHYEEACTTSSLREVLTDARAIPWRHFTNGDCHVWLSDAGLAEVKCDHEVVYRGFGSMKDGIFYAIPLHEMTPNDHDLQRTASIDEHGAK